MSQSSRKRIKGYNKVYKWKSCGWKMKIKKSILKDDEYNLRWFST